MTAFGHVTLQRPGGRPIDWSATKYAADLAEGMFDPSGSFFLLHRSGNGWQVIEFASGQTDVAWDGWRTDHSCQVRSSNDEDWIERPASRENHSIG